MKSLAAWLLILLYSLLVLCSATNIRLQRDVTEENRSATTSIAPLTSDAAAEELISDVWKWQLINFPQFATRVGVHLYDDKLNTISVENYRRIKDECKNHIERAKQLLEDANSIETTTNLKFLIEYLQTYVDGFAYKGYLFPLTKLDGPQASLELVYKRMDLSDIKGYRQLIARYKAFPKQADEIIEIMREGVRQNMTLNIASLTGIEKSFTRLQSTGEESPFFVPFKNISNNIPEGNRTDIQKEVKTVIEDYLKPAFKKLGNFIVQEYMKSLRTNVAISSLPNGKDYYEQCIRYHTNSNLSPQEIHQIGLKEVERLAAEMDKVILSLNLTMTREEFLKHLNNDSMFQFESSEEVIETYRSAIFSIIRPELFRVISGLPKLELLVEPQPQSFAGGPFASYNPGSLKENIAGIFYIAVSNPQNLRKYEVISLSLHEAEPGHHLQLSLNQELDIPDFRQYLYDGTYSEMPSNFPAYTAYIEGWALYSEFLGLELGLFEDLYTRYGYLSSSIFRACRLVVDTGIHALGWSRHDAIDFMLKYNTLSENIIQSEVDRYISWPGQALAYKLGEVKIKDLRARSQEALGQKYDVRDFHNVILRNQGSLKFLEEQIENYIQTQLKI